MGFNVPDCKIKGPCNIAFYLSNERAPESDTIGQIQWRTVANLWVFVVLLSASDGTVGSFLCIINVGMWHWVLCPLGRKNLVVFGSTL